MNKEHRDLEGDFQAGRSKTLELIAEDLRNEQSRYTAAAVKDFFAFGLKPEDRRVITAVVATPFMRHYRQYAAEAVKALQSGDALLTILGQEQIKKYSAVTGGDYDAGVMSAGHDMKYLLLGIDTDKVVDEFLVTLKGRRDLEAIFVKGAENNSRSTKSSEERPKPKYEDTLRRFLNMMIHTKLDGDLCKIQRKYIQEAKLPHIVGYNGAQPEPLRYRFFHAVYHRLAEPINVITRLKGKVPSAWPPIRISGAFNNNADNTAQAENTLSREDLAAYENALQVNENPAFQKGMQDALKNIYLETQTRHFDLMNDGKGGYAAKLGISSYWDNMVSQLSSQAFSDLRSDLRTLIHQPAKGEGETYEDGVQAAYDIAQKYIYALDTQTINTEQAEYERIISHFKAFWLFELNKIRNNSPGNSSPADISPPQNSGPS